MNDNVLLATHFLQLLWCSLKLKLSKSLGLLANALVDAVVESVKGQLKGIDSLERIDSLLTVLRKIQQLHQLKR
jgi:hypothetical protein